MQEWDYIKTECFVRSCEENSVSQVVQSGIEEWARSIRRQITPKNKRIFGSPNNVFEIWVAGIPNPEANKGKSGGYRLMYYLILNEKKFFSHLIENRSNLDYKGSSGKKQKKWNKCFSELKKYLLGKYEE